MARVVELKYYPVKGCAGVSVPEAVVTPAGLAHDRTFLVIGENGVFRSQRRDPLLARIRPEIDETGTLLTLRAEGATVIQVDVDVTGARRAVELFGAPYRGIDQGEPVAAWLSEVLGTPSRLVRVPPEHDRVTDGVTPGTSAYADSAPLLLTTALSLDLLTERIAERGGIAVPMTRFRPNIVVDGWGEPHAEDSVRTVRAGTAELGYSKLAIRCAVTTVDQHTGARVGPEPLRTLAGYRRSGQGGVAFGVKFSVIRAGRVSVGEELAVTSWGEPEL
ncbi:hypothetical protein SAMN05216266_10984 [Amycolatopsis marina]|uniref:MOSC domain-containing protein n=1 Tax=Amycolatopsis marina TaxID=490629 RepID=A0A1I1AF71_9PSEU|nr:MOSC N-terminal beta barrel domain-containing protein [Amycolatopsis marina]SFB36607.1 hypothetical protein SAMN05216266_10984 [Amycolatopsis marina]